MATALLDDDATTARASLYVGSGGTLDDGGTVTVDYGGDAETDGTLEIAGSLDIAGSGTMNDYGNVLIDSGGYAEFDGAAINDWPDNGGLPIQNSGTIQIDDDNLSLLAAGVISNSGTVCFAYDGTVNLSDLTLSGGTYEISGSTTATINSNMTLDNTYLQIDSGATLELNAALAVTDGGGVDNDGTADFNSAGSVTADDSSSIYNDADGTINAYGGLDISGTFSNSGTLNIASGGSVTIESAATFTDTGTLSVVDNGAITNDGIADLSGITLDTATASAIDNSGTVYIAAGDLSGLTLSGGTWAIAPNASASVSGSLTLANATLLIGYDTTLNVDGGTVAPDDNTSLAPSSIENYGTIDCSDGGTVYPALLGGPVLYQPATPTASVDTDGHTIDLTFTDSQNLSAGSFQVEEEDVTAGTNFALYNGWYSATITPPTSGDIYTAKVPWVGNSDEYIFRVRAVAPGDGVYSEPSNEVATNDYDASYGGTYTAPAPPGELTAQATSLPSVLLSWENNTSNETGYNIYRSSTDPNDRPSERYDSVGADVTNYVDEDAQAGHTYYYWVSAVSNSGEEFSGPVSATPTQPVLPTVTFSQSTVYTGVTGDITNFSTATGNPSPNSTLFAQVTATVSDPALANMVEFDTIGNSAEITVDEVSVDDQTGLITLDVYGRKASPIKRGDVDIVAITKDYCGHLAEASVVVVVPTSVKEICDAGPGGVNVTGVNRVLDPGTTPSIFAYTNNPNQPNITANTATWKELYCTVYSTDLYCMVLDQFGNPLNQIYQGQPVEEYFELRGVGEWIPINQILHVDPTYGTGCYYVDPVGRTVPSPLYGNGDGVESYNPNSCPGSPNAKLWEGPVAQTVPLPSNPNWRSSNKSVPFRVSVGGIGLAKPIVRLVTVTAPNPADLKTANIVVNWT